MTLDEAEAILERLIRRNHADPHSRFTYLSRDEATAMDILAAEPVPDPRGTRCHVTDGKIKLWALGRPIRIVE